MKRLSVIILAGAILCTACAGAPAQTPDVSSNSNNTVQQNPAGVQPSATPVPTDEPLAAMVNGTPITLAALERNITRRMDGFRALGDPMPADMHAYRLTVLDQMIDQLLIEEAAKVQSITVTDAELEAEVQENIKLAGGRDKWLAQIAADRMSEEEARTGLRSALLTTRMRDIVTASVGETAEQVHARHILVSSELTAQEVLTKINGGTDFAELAAEYSQDSSTRDTGGDLGWFAKGELLEPAVEDAAFALDINGFSQPVKSNLGYHIIQTLERVKDRPVTPETRYKLAARVFDAWLESLKKNAQIEKFV